MCIAFLPTVSANDVLVIAVLGHFKSEFSYATTFIRCSFTRVYQILYEAPAASRSTGNSGCFATWVAPRFAEGRISTSQRRSLARHWHLRCHYFVPAQFYPPIRHFANTDIRRRWKPWHVHYTVARCSLYNSNSILTPLCHDYYC